MRQFRPQMTEAELQQEIDRMQVEETGRRRTIDGYDCEEVVITNEDGVTTVWLTQDIDADWSAMYRMFMTQSRGRGKSPLEGMPPSLRGFPIEQTFVDAKGKETTTVQYRNIRLGNDIDRAPLDIEGIPVQEVGF